MQQQQTSDKIRIEELHSNLYETGHWNGQAWWRSPALRMRIMAGCSLCLRRKYQTRSRLLWIAIFQNVYGKKLHRRSRDQYLKDVNKKKRNSLRQGDLVFFTTSNSGNECGHVGIFLKDDKFIHASSSRGVIVDNLNNNYWTKHWLSGGTVK